MGLFVVVTVKLLPLGLKGHRRKELEKLTRSKWDVDPTEQMAVEKAKAKDGAQLHSSALPATCGAGLPDLVIP